MTRWPRSATAIRRGTPVRTAEYLARMAATAKAARDLSVRTPWKRD